MSAERSKQQVDLVTQIQDHFNNLCYMMYNYVGALQVRHVQRALLLVPAVTTKHVMVCCTPQRDAPPASVRGEVVEPGLATTDITSQARTLPCGARGSASKAAG